MKSFKRRRIIIKLIKDDLIHQHIMLGLNILGFGHDNAMLDIPQAVFSMMDLNTNDNRLQHLSDEYCDRAYHVTEIAFNDSESFQRLATEIYNWLAKERKKYLRKL